MSEKEVTKSQLMSYISMETEIQRLELQNVLKNFEVRKKNEQDVAETIKCVEATLKQLVEQTKKEKADVDKLQALSVKEIVMDFQQEMSREQEEYLEAKNKEEVTRQQLEGLKKQKNEMSLNIKEIEISAEKLKSLYQQRDALLSDIFNGEYGSVEENKLEEMYDTLMEKKERIKVADYKWVNGRKLLEHAVNQMVNGVTSFKRLKTLPPSNETYRTTTEARNNFVAAVQNIRSTQKYLESIQFPYCNPAELQTLDKAIHNIYTDMSIPVRVDHALQCYEVTMKRAAALLQWFDNVINNTIKPDLKNVTEMARKAEINLRSERVKLIKQKLEAAGESTEDIKDVGQSQMRDDDTDMQTVGVTQAKAVDDDGDMQQREDHPRPPPTPLPLSVLAPPPAETDLFGDISELKQTHQKNMEEFNKAQEINKARMEQGLQAKLQARRHKNPK